MTNLPPIEAQERERPLFDCPGLAPKKLNRKGERENPEFDYAPIMLLDMARIGFTSQH